MSTDMSKAIPQIPFDGKKESYNMWAAKFKSLCITKGVSNMILYDQDVPTDDVLLIKPTDEKHETYLVDLNKYQLQQNNYVAYAMLCLSMSEQVSFNAVESSKDSNLKQGNARTAWITLENIFKPKSNATQYELENKFNHSELRDEKKNPDHWFAEMDTIRMRLKLDFGEELSDTKIVTHIVYNIKPNCYQTIIQIVKRDLNRGVIVDLEELKQDLRQIYAQTRITSGKEHKGEIALLSSSKHKNKQVKKDCRICGKKGHIGNDCWENERNKDKRPNNWKTPRKDEKQFIQKDKKKCNYCGRENHTEDKCFKKLKDEKEASHREETTNLMFVTYQTNLSTTDTYDFGFNTWILDSGSTSHMKKDLNGMTDLVPFQSKITVGNQETIYSQQKGTYHGNYLNSEGIETKITLKDVLYVPDIVTNLFSMTKALNNPQVQIQRQKQTVVLSMGQLQLPFSPNHINTQLLTVDIKPILQKEENVNLTFTHQQLHEKLGHPHDKIVEQTAKKMHIKLTTSPEKCVNCVMAKAKRKKINKINTSRATKKGGRLVIDIASVNTKSLGGNNFWLLHIDEFTKMKWSFFLKQKSDLPETVLKFIINEEKNDTKFEIIRCDDSGENKKLQELIDSTNLKIKFEFSGPWVPQRNGMVERGFATLFGKTRAMLNSAQFNYHLRKLLWAQCASLATMLDVTLVSKSTNKSPHELWHGYQPTWINDLHVFGEIGIIYDSTKIKAKLDNRGFPAIFVGYPINHAKDVFQFFTIDKKSIILSRNITWLNLNYGQFRQLTTNEIYIDNSIQTEFFDDSDELINNTSSSDEDSIVSENQPFQEPESQQNSENTTNPNTIDQPSTTNNDSQIRKIIPRIKGIDRVVKNLTTSYNPNPLEHHEHNDSDDSSSNEEINNFMTQNEDICFISPEYNPFPKNYSEAMRRSDHRKWKEAINKEFTDIEKKNVWEFVPKTKIPTGRKIIGNRWVFAIKDDGRYRARTVAKGFSQIPGQDFHENHAPVINDTTFHLVLALMLKHNLQSKQFDVETAFLYGNLEEKLYMDFPDGYESYLLDKGINLKQSENCLLLNKALYGLVQAARQWWRKITEIFKTVGFLPSPADPCLFIQHQQKQISFIILYVDDGGIIATDETITQVMQLLNKHFNIKDLGPMKNFVGCELIKHNNSIWIHQPKLIKHLKDTFQEITEKKTYKTPAAPKTTIMRPEETDPLINKEKQSLYRSGVGMLLYLVKHSRPDIANAVRELSKVLDGATQAHWNSMLRTIKFIFDTEKECLKMKLNQDINQLTGFSDSEFGGDRDTRKSVYGYIIYYQGIPISWKSKAGKSVTLSSTEAEYYAASETAKELLFIHNLMESMKIQIKKPMILRMDNTGAIYIANNHTTGQRTKHIDIRTHFVRNMILDDIIKVSFVKSEDNDADIFTKNVSEHSHINHKNKMITDLPTNHQ